VSQRAVGIAPQVGNCLSAHTSDREVIVALVPTGLRMKTS
jgi:hypothetical protein